MLYSYPLIVYHGDSEERIETGLTVALDTENEVIILPFHNEMTAEEVFRIMCGLARRNDSDTPEAT